MIELKGTPDGDASLQGTWGHPYVAIYCGQWCSAKFAVLVSKWVFEWIVTTQNQIQSVQASPEFLAIAKAYTESAQALNRFNLDL